MGVICDGSTLPKSLSRSAVSRGSGMETAESSKRERDSGRDPWESGILGIVLTFVGIARQAHQ